MTESQRRIDAACASAEAVARHLSEHPGPEILDPTALATQVVRMQRYREQIAAAAATPDPIAAPPAEYARRLRYLQTLGDDGAAAIAWRCLRELARATTYQDPDAPIRLRVARVRPTGRAAVRIQFQVPPHRTLEHLAGQHVGLARTEAGIGVHRYYSLATAPGSAAPAIAVRSRSDGYLSRRLQHLRPGDWVELGPPQGAMVWPPPDYGPPDSLLLIAAGSGVVPLVSIATTALRCSAADITMVIVERAAADVMLLEDLRRSQREYGGRLRLIQHHTARAGRPTGQDLTAWVRAVGRGRRRATYLCGPGPFMDLVRTRLRGVRGPVLSEDFDAVGAGIGIAGTVRLASGRTVRVEAGESLLTALLRDGQQAAFSCLGGTCHSCVVAVADAGPLSTRAVLTESRDGAARVLACQAVVTKEDSDG